MHQFVGIDDRYLLHLKSTRGFRSCNRNRNIRHFLGCHQHNHDWKLPLNLKLPLGWTTVKITLWKYKWLHAHAQHSTHTHILITKFNRSINANCIQVSKSSFAALRKSRAQFFPRLRDPSRRLVWWHRPLQSWHQGFVWKLGIKFQGD